MRRFCVTSALLLLPVLLHAELTPAQRESDFRTLAAVFARHYGPMNWKYEASGFDGLDLTRWLARVAEARNDLEFLDVCAEYVAAYNDGHTAFRTASGLIVNLGLNVDLYDGKVLIENIDRGRYPVARFPFQVGDELVSLDGIPVAEWITRLARFRGMGNPRTNRRQAAEAITIRSQVFYPSLAIVPDTATAVIRRDGGETDTYTLAWTRAGIPLTELSPLPELRAKQAGVRRSGEEEGEAPAYLRNLEQMRTWRADPDEPGLGKFEYTDANGEARAEQWVLGWGALQPVWAFPASLNFQRRLGGSPADPFVSGVYQFQGKRLGYLRIPGFGTQPVLAQIFANEIAFLKQNTDGLVVDVMRNSGGGCIGVDYLLQLVPDRLTTFEQQYRVTQSWLLYAQSNLQAAQALRAEPWVVETWRYIAKAFEETYRDNRAMTGSIPPCAPLAAQAPVSEWPALRNAQGGLVAYDKPIILLVDEYSVSFGDIFPAMFQDNRRGPVVGVRTAGWGAQNSFWPAGPYSEASTTMSRTMVTRFTPVATPEFPTRPYLENIGVRPDIELDYMTRENLMNRGAPFVEAFSRILADRIR